MAQERSARPPARDVCGDDHWTGETCAQQVRDGHPAHQSVEGGLLLFLLGDAKHHDRHEVSEDSEAKHSGRSDERAIVQAQITRRAIGERRENF